VSLEAADHTFQFIFKEECMANTESFQAREMTASLTVADLRKSVAWYRDAVGFLVDREMERDGQLRSVAVSAGSVRILLNLDDGKKGMNRTKGEGFSLQLITPQSVDDIAKRIKAAGGTLDSDPADMPWGVRMFRVRDPDGFKIAISQRKDGA
jgi:uncharacterized glyoxalase superfamily protein PhnB